jgi:hypothetical protein
MSCPRWDIPPSYLPPGSTPLVELATGANLFEWAKDKPMVHLLQSIPRGSVCKVKSPPDLDYQYLEKKVWIRGRVKTTQDDIYVNETYVTSPVSTSKEEAAKAFLATLDAAIASVDGLRHVEIFIRIPPTIYGNETGISYEYICEAVLGIIAFTERRED